MIGEFDGMAEHRRQRRDIDAGRRETILERRIRAMIPDARAIVLMRSSAVKRELRVRGAKPLVPKQRIGDAPAIVQFADQVLGRNDDIVEEHLAEFVVVRDRLDRPDP